MKKISHIGFCALFRMKISPVLVFQLSSQLTLAFLKMSFIDFIV